MKVIRQTYVVFQVLHQGMTDFSNPSQVENRDLSLPNIKVPKEALGFQFFDILSLSLEDSQVGTVELKSQRVGKSPMYYFGSCQRISEDKMSCLGSEFSCRSEDVFLGSF